MIIKEKVVEGIFHGRENKFLGLAKVEGKEVYCHIANSGRLDILRPGVRGIFREALAKGRKSNFDLIAIYHNNQKVLIDTKIANQFVEECLKKRRIKELSQYNFIKRDYPFRKNKIDFFINPPDFVYMIFS